MKEGVVDLVKQAGESIDKIKANLLTRTHDTIAEDVIEAMLGNEVFFFGPHILNASVHCNISNCSIQPQASSILFKILSAKSTLRKISSKSVGFRRCSR
jgi:hypothetical protein